MNGSYRTEHGYQTWGHEPKLTREDFLMDRVPKDET